jgi:hypothetical protein
MNVGTNPEKPLTRIIGDRDITTDGTILRDLDIRGRVRVRAAGVRIQNCRIRGARAGEPGFPTGPTQYRPLIDARVSCRDLLIEDCHLEPDDPTAYWEAGVSGTQFTILRSLITRTVDGIRINNASNPPLAANVYVAHNIIGWLGYFRADAPGIVHPSDTETHCDALHIEGTDGAVIEDNDLYAYWAEGWGDYDTYGPSLATSDMQAIQVNNRTGDPARNITLRRNNIYGGRIPVNLGGAPKVDASHRILTANRNVFAGDAGIVGQTILLDTSWNGAAGADCGEGTPLRNRLYDITGPEITVRRTG